MKKQQIEANMTSCLRLDTIWSRSVLLEYASVKEEIKDLRQRITEDKKNIKNIGESVSANRKKQLLDKNIAMLEELETVLLERQIQIEEYIQSVEKSEMRMLLRLYFIDNLPYFKVAMEMNERFPKRQVKYTDENVKKRIQRFLHNVPQCPGKDDYSVN